MNIADVMHVKSKVLPAHKHTRSRGSDTPEAVHTASLLAPMLIKTVVTSCLVLVTTCSLRQAMLKTRHAQLPTFCQWSLTHSSPYSSTSACCHESFGCASKAWMRTYKDCQRHINKLRHARFARKACRISSPLCQSPKRWHALRLRAHRRNTKVHGSGTQQRGH